jgi:hypothetical protein
MVLAAYGVTSADPLLDQGEPGLALAAFSLFAWCLLDCTAFVVSEKHRSLHDLMAGTVAIRGE